MQFLKKHFEKIILSLVVLALGAAAYWEFTAVKGAKDDIALPTAGPAPAARGKKDKSYTSIDLTALEASLKNLKDVPDFSLTGEHNLFNPVIWKMKRDGFLFKMTLGGAAGLSVTDIVPFYSSIHLDSVTSDGYWINYTPANEGKPIRTRPVFAKIGEKPDAKKPYTVVSAATNDNTLMLQLKLTGREDTVPLTADKDYRQVEGYFADFNYKSSDEDKTIKGRKVGDLFTLSGEDYKVIAITNNSVTIQDHRTQQRSIKNWNGGH